MTDNEMGSVARRTDRALASRAQGLGPSGFDPSRMAALQVRCDTFEDCLRTVCHHLQLPQSKSGPCDDYARYEKALESLDILYRSSEAERVVAVARMHRAEAALEPFARAASGIGTAWDNNRNANTLNIPNLRVRDYRRALQVLNVARDSDGSPKGGDVCGSVHDSAAIAQPSTAKTSVSEG